MSQTRFSLCLQSLSRSPARWVAWILVLLSTWLGAYETSARAQQDAPTRSETTRPSVTPFKRERIGRKDDLPDRKTLGEFRILASGTEESPLKPEERRKIMEKMAFWLTCRLTWQEVQEGRDPSLTMEHLMEGVEGGPIILRTDLEGKSYWDWNGVFRAIPIPRANEDPKAPEVVRRRQFVKEFWPVMRPHLERILVNEWIMARLNAVRIVERFILAGIDDAAAPLFPVIDHPNEHEGVKYWAFHGLGELLGRRGDSSAPTAEKLRQHATRVLYRELEKRCRFAEADLLGLSPGELDAIRYVRRTLIRGLANSQRAALAAADRAAQVEAPIAELMVRYIREPQSILPEPSNAERVEAAYALTQMDPKLTPGFRVLSAAYHYGVLVADLGRIAGDTAQRDKDRWAFYGYHLSMGLDDLEKHAKGTADKEAIKYVADLRIRVQRVLDNLRDPKKEPGSADSLRDWLSGDGRPQDVRIVVPPTKE